MSGLFVIVPGFGGPHLSEKESFLRGNLAKVRTAAARGWGGRLTVVVCVYNNNYALPDDIARSLDVRVVYEPGIVGEFIKRHAGPAATSDYSHVMVMFDDVELQADVDIASWARYMSDLRLDIVSPSMTRDSVHQYAYMMTQPHIAADIKITTVCEAFCYMMHQQAFKKWYDTIDAAQNPWLWGIDLVLHRHLGMLVAMLNHQTFRHHYKNEGYLANPHANPANGYDSLLAAFGETRQSLAEQPALRYWVFDATPPPERHPARAL